MKKRYLFALSFALMSACLAGCGGGPKLVKVSGTVTHNGKPYPDALIEFVPDPSNTSITPGTDVTMDGATLRGHCVNSRSRTYDGDGWVRVEAIVRGDTITHLVEGTPCCATRTRASAAEPGRARPVWWARTAQGVLASTGSGGSGGGAAAGRSASRPWASWVTSGSSRSPGDGGLGVILPMVALGPTVSAAGGGRG